MKTDNTNIPMWLLRICNQPLFIYMTFKQFGFFNGLKILFSYTHTFFYFWFIRNCKWYRNRVYKNLKSKYGDAGEMLFEMMVDTPNWDPKKLLNKHPEFKQSFIENFEAVKQDVINTHIQSGELKTEEDIRKFGEELKLENFI